MKDANPLCQATIQIDPTFAYYVDRSEASVAAELEQAGYRSVRYFVTDETKINGRLVRALRERGMEVWAMALGNGAYGTGHLPPAWRSWQMELLKPVNDGYVRLSPFSAGYTAWKKIRVSPSCPRASVHRPGNRRSVFSRMERAGHRGLRGRRPVGAGGFPPVQRRGDAGIPSSHLPPVL